MSDFFLKYTVVGGILGSAFTFLGTFLIHSFRRPRLTLETEAIKNTSWTNSDGKVVHSNFMKIRVKNTGKTVVKNARVFLMGAYKYDEKHLLSNNEIESKVLSWASRRDSFDPRDIYPSLEFFVNIVNFQSDSDKWIFRCEELFTSELPICEYKGTLKLIIVACGENVEPVKLEVKIDFNGDYLTAKWVG